MVPWSIRRVTGLPLNAKLHKMQQNTHQPKKGQSISPTRKGPDMGFHSSKTQFTSCSTQIVVGQRLRMLFHSFALSFQAAATI